MPNAAADGSRAHGGWPPSALSSRGFGGSILTKWPGCGNCRVRKPAFDRATQGHGVAKGWGWTSHSKNPKPPAASSFSSREREPSAGMPAGRRGRLCAKAGTASLTSPKHRPTLLGKDGQCLGMLLGSGLHPSEQNSPNSAFSFSQTSWLPESSAQLPPRTLVLITGQIPLELLVQARGI